MSTFPLELLISKFKTSFQPDSRNDSSMPQEYDFSHHLSPSVAAGALSLDIPSPVPPVDQAAEDLEDEPDAPLVSYDASNKIFPHEVSASPVLPWIS